MAVAWIVGGCALGSLLAALLAFLAIAQARAWRANRQVYLRPPDLSPAQVRWANEKRLGDDPEATLIIPAGHPDYIRPVDWQALRARGRPWPFRTGGGPGGLQTPHDARSVGRRCHPPHG
jgi:hypothetical protein